MKLRAKENHCRSWDKGKDALAVAEAPEFKVWTCMEPRSRDWGNRMTMVPGTRVQVHLLQWWH